MMTIATKTTGETADIVIGLKSTDNGSTITIYKASGDLTNVMNIEGWMFGIVKWNVDEEGNPLT